MKRIKYIEHVTDSSDSEDETPPIVLKKYAKIKRHIRSIDSDKEEEPIKLQKNNPAFNFF